MPMHTRRSNRSASSAARGVAVLAISLLAWNVGVSSAQQPIPSELPAPQRPGVGLTSSPPSPYESETPHRVTDITLQAAELIGAAPTDLSTKLFGPAVDLDTRRTRGWTATEYCWVPTCIAYHPLYFQQTALDRYGETLSPCFQPVVSAGQFYATALALPGLVILESPGTCQYAYGYAPAGSPGQ
jgi:hypothetical protein